MRRLKKIGTQNGTQKLNTKERSLHKCFRFFSANGRLGTLLAFFFCAVFLLIFCGKTAFFYAKI
nr:MAG TPA_asm: hypothetical protein [Caudoviricetes sp.]DAL55467.1 MAG TPA_asm: hypothetical protein [Caudoviricetes sp.]DAZ01428.1 MAG TPA: hypothetical protein [Caudoviricetes sp.]